MEQFIDSVPPELDGDRPYNDLINQKADSEVFSDVSFMFEH